MVFGEYARYYDDLYAEKDYTGECDFLEKLIGAHSLIPVNSILDLGCGTGGHLIPLAQRGYRLTGVDRSEEMLNRARDKASQFGVSANLIQGDLRTVDLHDTFDLVVAMFAVMCYQVDNNDLLNAFQTARRHVKPGRLFVFDGWFGPAVLAIRPVDRVKIRDTDGGRLIRLVHSQLDVLAHTVQVDYVILRLDGKQVVDEVEESHSMRYLFAPEISLLCQISGFELIQCCPFLDPSRKPEESDWNVTWVARAI